MLEDWSCMYITCMERKRREGGVECVYTTCAWLFYVHIHTYKYYVCGIQSPTFQKKHMKNIT